MIKKTSITILIVFNLFAIFYLVTPVPKVPDLINSVKSDQHEDTVDIPNVSGYYTDMTRAEVMKFYRDNYGGLLKINLNYPPERSKDLFRINIQSYYLEELSIPFKESLYINGFEWENDVFNKPENRSPLPYKGKDYKSRITIRTFPTSIPKRLISFFLTEFTTIIIILVIKSFIIKKKK